MVHISDERILEGISRNDADVVRYVYESNYKKIECLVCNHQGDPDQAKDVFHEALLVIFQKIRKNELVLTCAFSTFLYAVCRNIWFHERRRQQRHYTLFPTAQPFVEENGHDEEYHKLGKALFDLHFKRLSRDCQRILTMHFNGQSIAEIREEMGYKSIHHTADRKYRCKKSLLKRITGDPRFKKIRDGIY